MSRGFEVAKGFENSEIDLPCRETLHAAGYDFECAQEITIKPIWSSVFARIGMMFGFYNTEENESEVNGWLKPTLVKTGVKAYMEEDEALFLYNRSGNPIKKFLLLGNGVGVVDSDYFGNENNDGHIMFQFINFGFFPLTIVKGERIGQGVFQKFLLKDNDTGGKALRKGGHGHTK